MTLACYSSRRLDSNILQSFSTRLFSIISSYCHIWSIPLCPHHCLRQSKNLMITSRKQTTACSNFTLVLILITTYNFKVSVSNSCVVEDILPLGCCVLSPEKETPTFQTILIPSFSGTSNIKSP